jgi:hypothetical protein
VTTSGEGYIELKVCYLAQIILHVVGATDIDRIYHGDVSREWNAIRENIKKFGQRGFWSL